MRIPEILLGILLTVAVFAMGMLFQSSRPSQNVTQQQQTTNISDHLKAPSSAEERIADYTLALAVLTAILAASTIGLWVVTWTSGTRQSRDMQDSIQLARDEFNSTHRPKIRIKHVWLTSDIWQGDRIVVTVVCVNSGTTEAIVIDCGVQFVVLKEGRMLPPRPQIDGGARLGDFPLHSGISLEIPEVSDGTTLSDTEHAAIRNGEAKLYCLGGIQYRDTVGGLRTTAFCRVLTFPERPGSYQDTGRFTVVNDPDYEYQD